MNGTNHCLTAAQLDAIELDCLPEDDRTWAEQHLQDCISCCQRLESSDSHLELRAITKSYLRDDDYDQTKFGGWVPTTRDTDVRIETLLKGLAPTDDPSMLGRLGCYEISGVIGCGGMGIVLKAFEPALGRFVALKVLSPNYWKDSVARERFIREARAAASIVHEGVIEIYGVAETNGIPYFAMPYIRGDSLQKRIDRSGPLAIDEILRIGMQVAGGLAAAHAQGLVHRDVKPANVLLGDGIDRARLSDFGIARFDSDASITSTGYVPGTPQYMSPEQVRGESIDHRSDLFSFGSLLYTMCVGHAPFEAETSFELLNQIVSVDPPRLERLRPELPIWLVALIDRLHEKDPNDRLQSASETRLLIEQCLARWQQPSTVVLPALASTLEKQYRQKSAEKLNHLSTKGFVMLATLFTLIVGGVVLPLFAPNLLSGLAGEEEEAIGLQGRLIDDEGKPVGNVEVWAVQKTWPNNRFQQQVLKVTSDSKGEFAFADFAIHGKQYAFLLSVVSPEYLLTSEYRLVKDGSPQDPIVLQLTAAPPTTFKFIDTKGKALSGVKVIPSTRDVDDSTQMMCYAQQLRLSNYETNEQGEVRLACWKVGEKGSIYYDTGQMVEEAKFQLSADQLVTIIVPEIKKPAPTAAKVSVSAVFVDESGKPAADLTVAVVRKTWPNNRYRQDGSIVKTDKNGGLTLKDFADLGSQYACMLTVVSDKHAMTSHYFLTEDGAQLETAKHVVQANESIPFQVVDSEGSPLADVEISPRQRLTTAGDDYLNYHMNAGATAQKTGAEGELSLSYWKRGEEGKVFYRKGNNEGELQFEVPESGAVLLKINTGS